jgi:hypothetical protein
MKMETKTEAPDFTCSHYFGYLSQLSGGKETPDECMVCKKLLECKLSKPDSTPPRLEPKTVAIEEAKQSVEEPTMDTAREELEEIKEFETKTESSPVESSGNQFAVENVGQLYASWSGTVFINKDTLSGWGGKIKEVDIQTKAGKKMRCKAMPSEDPRKGIILIPDKIQLTLEVKKDELVIVEPVVLLELEDKARNIVRAFINLKKNGRKSARQHKT